MSTSDTPRTDYMVNVCIETPWRDLTSFIDFARQLERELNEARDEQMSALALVARIREALGDNGKRMQDELIAYCRELAEARKDSERLDWLLDDKTFRYGVVDDSNETWIASREEIDAAREGGR